MNGPHDMGGMQCFGPVLPEPDEPVFHAEWEKKAMALTVAMGFTGTWNIDQSRQARETIPPADYLSFSYYQIWLAGLEKLIISNGLATAEEVKSGIAITPAIATKNVLELPDVAAALARGGPVERKADRSAKFTIGQSVRTMKSNPVGHTRLPRYARNAVGMIDAIQGFHVFPDANATGKGEQPHWLYSVRFSARELFGGSADANQEILVDCWEPYLELC